MVCFLFLIADTCPHHLAHQISTQQWGTMLCSWPASHFKPHCSTAQIRGFLWGHSKAPSYPKQAQLGSASCKCISRSNPQPTGVLRCSVLSDSLWPSGLQPTRILCPWDFPGKNTGVGCHSLLQEIFLNQGSNPRLLHWQADSWPLSHQGSIQPTGDMN